MKVMYILHVLDVPLLTDFGIILLRRESVVECLLSVKTQAKWWESTAVRSEDRKL